MTRLRLTLRGLTLISFLTITVLAESDVTKDSDKIVTKGEASEHSLVKSDLETAATGFGGGYGGGIGQGGGFGGGNSQGGGFGGGYGGGNGFGGAKQVGGGGNFGSTFGGVNNNAKGFQSTYGNVQKGTIGHKGNQGFLNNNGVNKIHAGHVNNALKKGNFGVVGGFQKAAKNDGVAFANNDLAVKAAKGHKFGQKGIHKKGHATKGFRNQVHKDEFVKTHTFHDSNNVDNFFDKYGDENTAKNDFKGDKYYKGHHTNLFNKNHQNNAGHYLNGHNNQANKGVNSIYGQKAHNGHNAKYSNHGGNNFSNGFNKGVHHNNNYGGQYGGGFGKKNGGFGGNGYNQGYGGGSGFGGGYGGGQGFGVGHGGGGFGIGR